MHFERLSYSSALERQSQLVLEAKKADTKTVRVLSFESEPIITMGVRARGDKDVLRESILQILKVDRGGEATYHGPGQLVLFPVLHLPTWKLSVREWVCLLLNTTSELLREFDIPSEWSEDKPGLFTPNGKIASVGLKIKNGWSSHGLALNVRGDLSPFRAIRACGVKDAAIDQMARWPLAQDIEISIIAQKWERLLEQRLL